MAVTLNGTNGVTFNDGSAQNTAATGFGFKNRIINGACAINQRNVTLSTNNSSGYFVDRMWGFSGASTAVTFSQISSTGLTGFPNAARAQRTAANTGTGGMYIGQIVESNNLQDLQGQSVTVSFWARAGSNYSATSSLLTVGLRTGTTADQGLAALISGWAGAVDQTSTVTLTTSWQSFSKTFTVASNVQELSAYFFATTVGTAGANDYFDITGIQLEKGTTATSFDYRPYGTELQLCQRYYQNGGSVLSGTTEGTTLYSFQVQFFQQMRVAPTGGTRTGYYFNVRYSGTDVSILNPTTTISNTTLYGAWAYVTSSGLTGNLPIVGRQQNGSDSNNFMSFNAEL